LKLLVDNNISFKLVAEFADSFSGSNHVRDTVGVEADDDIMVWQYALENDFLILTKDNDFDERSLLAGCPPKIIHLVCGNKSSDYILNLILRNKDEIILFSGTDKENCILKIS
jgi:predicted nuclease of predicted toxin-antitoxin system